MTNHLHEVEQKLQAAQNKRIEALEAKYLALMDDLKALRMEMTKEIHRAIISSSSDSAGNLNTYQPAFDRWPGAER